MGEWRELEGVNEGRGTTKIQCGLTKPKTERSFSANLVSFRRLRSPPKNKIVKIRCHQFDRDPDYMGGLHRSFLSLLNVQKTTFNSLLVYYKYNLCKKQKLSPTEMATPVGNCHEKSFSFPWEFRFRGR
jgi:hypothetical protein